MSIIELVSRFRDEETCLAFLAEIRWPNGVHCPHCGSDGVHDLPNRREWQCNDCRKQFSVTSGTIMHRSHLPVQKWLLAIHLVCNAKKGVSACELQRNLDVAYRTAWYLLHRIREAMVSDGLLSRFAGPVEADETYLATDGPHRIIRTRFGRGTDKTPIFGVLERGGQIRIRTVPDVTQKTLLPLIEEATERGAQVYTDEWAAYSPLRHRCYRHGVVNHIERYVDGMVHTNGVENFWSLLKRGIIGTYHHASLKHLPRSGVAPVAWTPHLLRDIPLRERSS